MIPVVISGGSGTRLWPVSRSSYPKQFCEFYDNSFLKSTFDRLKPFGEPIVLTVESMRDMTKRGLPELKSENLLCEPFGKNTAPAIALLCKVLESRGMSNEVAGVFPADHLVVLDDAFKKVVNLAIEVAMDGRVVTLGIFPRYPATGYGYIEVTEDRIQDAMGFEARKVAGFREKPNESIAREFVDTGKHFWNSGMFIFKVSKMIEHFKKYMPDTWNRIEKLESDFSNASTVYSNIESQSIDYGIMEKLEDIACIPCEIGWSDVGSWDELARIAEEQPDYRADSKAKIYNVDSTNNYVFSVKDKVIGMIDVRNLVVVETPDALLISKKGSSEKVREVVQQVHKDGRNEATDQQFEVRPWGMFEILSDAESYKAKKIIVDPDQQLSEQSHEKRSEHWIFISGSAQVMLDGKKLNFKGGDYVHIPQQARHRVKNVGKDPLVFVEVQTGSYFGEDDIKRYQDDYQRV